MANLSPAPLLADAPYASAADALLIARNLRDDVADALAATGIRIRAHAELADANPSIEEAGLDLILLDAREAEETALLSFLAMPSRRDSAPGSAIVAIIASSQLDLATPLLGRPEVQLLCDPRPAELLVALTFAVSLRERMPRLQWQDVTRDSDAIGIRRMREDIARIADVLERMDRESTDREEIARRGGIREPESGYRGPEPEGPEVNPAEIRAVIRARRLRGRFFTPELFADPAWDMLLDLFAAELEQRRVSVSSLCIAAAVPPTTALRWIGTMHEEGLFRREADPIDRRRAYIVLSERALHGMRAYANAAQRAGLNLA